MGEMEPNDYQLVRIGLLAAISDRARELGEEIFNEAEDTIDDLRAERDRLRGEVAMLREALAPFAHDFYEGADPDYHIVSFNRRDGNPPLDWYARDVQRAQAALAAMPAGCPLAGGTRGERERAVIAAALELDRATKEYEGMGHDTTTREERLKCLWAAGGAKRRLTDAVSALVALDAPPAGREGEE